MVRARCSEDLFVFLSPAPISKLVWFQPSHRDLLYLELWARSDGADLRGKNLSTQVQNYAQIAPIDQGGVE